MPAKSGFRKLPAVNQATQPKNRLYSKSQCAEDRFFPLAHNEVISSKDFHARPDSTTAANSPFAGFFLIRNCQSSTALYQGRQLE